MGTGTGTSAVAGTGRKAPEMQPNLPSTEYIKKYTVEKGRQESKIRKDGREREDSSSVLLRGRILRMGLGWTR